MSATKTISRGKRAALLQRVTRLAAFGGLVRTVRAAEQRDRLLELLCPPPPRPLPSRSEVAKMGLLFEQMAQRGGR